MSNPARLRPLAASAARPLLRRNYAAKPTPTNPNLVQSSDSRSDLLRQTLYPADSYAPTSSSPTGTYHPDHLARLQAVIPSSEAYETIERAWQLYQRTLRKQRQTSLEAKYDSMVKACDELEAITNPANGGAESETGKGGKYHRRVYEWATADVRQAERRGEQPRGKKTVEQRWKETRVEGLVPRESWVPVESRGKGWDYSWTRPGHSK
ncbi:hypothetical protein CI109_101483 [Kwoniella shandongensis]|uniref:Uncharacterized protein n=1 Tax=Kwoniella shandongensis TaxID=1734106 RepID=A0A5M6C441_9TREE|nr:uncharacterized protein CI109_001925 [Kwoniella shandongensis]KAA5529500.1 hypothetical protein CI109_001925 [Kwoniella shandongensis]